MSAGTAARQLLITSESDVVLVDHVGTLRVTNWFQDLPLRHIQCDAPLPSTRVDDAAALGATAPSVAYSISQSSKADAVLVASQHAVALVALPSRTERARQLPCPDFGPGARCGCGACRGVTRACPLPTRRRLTPNPRAHGVVPGSLSRAPASVHTSEFNTTLVGHTAPPAAVPSGVPMGGGFSLAAPVPGAAARSGAGGAGAGAGASPAGPARKAELELEQDVAVTLQPPARRGGIARYSLAWGKNAVERVDGAADVSVPAGATSVTLPRGTRVPRETTHLLAYVSDLRPAGVLGALRLLAMTLLVVPAVILPGSRTTQPGLRAACQLASASVRRR